MGHTSGDERAGASAHMRSHRVCVLVALVALGASCTPLHAQGVVPGQVGERIVSVTDPTQSYAIYVPASYDAGRKWPIVVLMDPRGRALVPLRLFQVAAERDGYILISSYNTLSDGPPGPNVAAVNAMLGDAEATFSLDPRRYYLAGFSGTARVAWDFALQLKEHAAGIFGASAGVPTPPFWLVKGTGPPKVAFYGTAGSTDFNYAEMQSFRGKPSEWGLPERFRFFDGPHAWPPEDLCSEAIDWFTLQAMRSGFIETRSPFVDSLYETDLAQADTLERQGRLFDARERYREMVADYDGLHELRDVRGLESALDESPRLREQVDERDRLLKRFSTYGKALYAYLDELRAKSPPADSAEIMHHLQITDLLGQARADDAGGYTARRMLELAFVQLAFYEPRAELRNDRPDHAITLLRVAGAIHAHNPTVLLNLARAFTEAGRPDDAFDALAQAVDRGVSAGFIREDSTLVSLHADPRFEQVLHSRR
jgi:tetratricopeptide (TPR) repeat protein